jgi:Pyruvate/2-oxoacid:ferredoxin oxidoreductase delta subunit
LLHPGSPLGLVTLREETCTACGACPAACPTGALGIEETAEATAITYDARLCVACGRCVRVCPEAAHDTVGLHTGTRLAALEGGRVTLKLAPAARCRRCGGPIAPDAMLRRIRDTLAEDAGAKPLLDVLTGLCVGCRGLETSTGHPAEHWPS